MGRHVILLLDVLMDVSLPRPHKVGGRCILDRMLLPALRPVLYLTSFELTAHIVSLLALNCEAVPDGPTDPP